MNIQFSVLDELNENYDVVIFNFNNRIPCYALVDKETKEPFKIATLNYGSYDCDNVYDNDMDINQIPVMKTEYFEIYNSIKSYFEGGN